MKKLRQRSDEMTVTVHKSPRIITSERQGAMRNNLIVSVAALAAIAGLVRAEDAKTQSTARDYKLIEGAWRVVALTVDGKESNPDDIRELVVLNGADGTWTVQLAGKEISKGTSSFDASKRPKTIDFTLTVGADKDKKHLGIYEIGKSSRKLCFASPGKPRPTDFVAKPGSGHTLVQFERVTE